MKTSGFVLLFVLSCVAPAFGQAVNPRLESYYADKLSKSPDTGNWQSLGPSGTWWRNPALIAKLSLTSDQQKRMEDVFQQSRIPLIDTKAILDKEEAILEPMLAADRLDEIKVAAQIDRVANARAELEKANAKMLLGIRQVLTPEQWTTLHNFTFIGAYDKFTTKNSLKSNLNKLVKPK
ncbi:MAG TPA: Spy/CpxP family protein refolding chaperone [Terriglobia bacterium]|nr:Spy/CpxP family protein refolding chaperone [Terriglobia bacterium]